MDLIHGSGAQSPPPAFPVNISQLLGNHLCVGTRLIVLRCKGRRFVFQHLHGFHTQLGADCRQLVKQTSTCLIFCNAHLFLAMISPVSSPTSMRIIVTPVISSPLMTAHWIGAAPRYFGSRDACTLMHPYFGRSRILFGRICPKAATMMISGANFSNIPHLHLPGFYRLEYFQSMGNRTFLYRWKLHGIPASLWFVRLCNHKHNLVSGFYDLSNVFTAKSGVPIKITFILFLFRLLIIHIMKSAFYFSVYICPSR